MPSPTQRSLAYCRQLGWQAQVVEKWNPHAKIRQDLFGCIDIVACDGENIVGIQSTSRTNVPTRVAKSLAEPKLNRWLKSGGTFQVCGWGKGGPSKRWQLRVVHIGTPGVLHDAVFDPPPFSRKPTPA